MKRVKEDFPAIQILPLDLEPDTSFANVENRLQMLIMNEKSRHMEQKAAETIETENRKETKSRGKQKNRKGYRVVHEG